MPNVIREDVIKVSVEANDGNLSKLSSELDKLKQSVTGGVSNGLDKLKKSVSQSGSGLDEMKTKMSSAATETTKLADSLNKMSGIDKLKADIESGDAKLQKFTSTLNSIRLHPLQAMSSAFDSVDVKISSTVSKLKNLASTKITKVKTDIDNIKTALTGGESGIKGFKNALSSIAKISISKVSSGFTKLKSSISNITSKLTGGEKGIKGFVNGFKKVASVSLSKLKSGLTAVASKLSEVARKASGAAFKGLKKLATVSFKGLAVGLAGAATAIGAVVTKAVSAYANNEQLVGGVDTLFKNSSDTVQQYANNAYKTAGLSANAYMETVTGFSASLLQSLGGDTEKAAKSADMAITDMADNSNKMGTSMESIQDAYQGFAKQNYTMLDNLKLGKPKRANKQQNIVVYIAQYKFREFGETLSA